MFGKFFGGSKEKKPSSSSSSKTSAKSSPAKKKNSDDPLAALGIDPSLLEDPLDDDDAAMDDADMDVDVDAIMNEINAPKKQPAKGGASKSSPASSTKTSKQAPAEMNITIDINSLPNEDEEPEIELTDEDMKDPSLLSQLLELGVEGIDQDPELAALMNQGSAQPIEDEEELELDAEDLQDPALLKEFKSIGGSWTDPKTKKRKQQTKLLEDRIKEYKEAALKSKKENDIEQAKDYLRIYKSMEQMLASVQGGAEIDESKIPAPPKATTKAPQTKPAEPTQPAPKATQPAPSPAQVPKEAQPKQTTPQPKATVQPAPQSTPPQPQTPTKAPQPKAESAAVPVQAIPQTTNQAPTKVSTQAVPPKAVTQPTTQPAAPAKAATQPTVQAKSEPTKTKDNIQAVIETRISEYKNAALVQKKAGNINLAKEYLTSMKKCQAFQEKHQRGEPVDVSQLPPSLQSKVQNTPPKQTAPPTQTPKKAPQPTKPAQAATQPNAKAEEDEDPNPVENMISNDVLEWALQDVNAQISKLKGKSVPEDLADRKQAIEMQIQLLTVRVSSGALDQDQYLNNMRAKIEHERQLAKKYVGQGKRDWASLALKRAKIMEEEIKMTLEAASEE